MTSSLAISVKDRDAHKEAVFQGSVFDFFDNRQYFYKAYVVFLRVDHCNDDLKIKDTL